MDMKGAGIMDTRKFIYKVETFGCTFSSREKYQRQLQEVIDRNAAEGWILHSSGLSGEGTICTVIFYKDAGEAIASK